MSVKKILCLDLGKKRIGIAVSDSLGLTAQPLCYITRLAKDKTINEILRLVEENMAEQIVVGVPYNMDGTVGRSAQAALDFIEDLRKKTSLLVKGWDERLSTAAVTRVLIEGNVRRDKRKEKVDKLAASYILQGYLDSLTVE
jgi:putative Holliday junction resolvase